MTPERWRRVEDLFNQAIAVPPGDRDAWLDLACGDDTGLRDEVRSLLESDGAGGALAAPIRNAIRAFDDRLSGQRVGNYQLLELIGRGGMGAVYRAQRVDREYQSTVAIKLVRPGMDTEFVLRRFRRERQTLARLNHPSIARLLDGGTTGEGVPYIVMEYVDGVWITDYCRSKRLGVRERLSLFLEVCAAVDHAHRHFIVHRDLKPGNILIDHTGTPKLLDFGICKLLSGDGAEADLTLASDLGMMTPDYASPEQVRGEAITPQSDVYSLGAVLYEVLTGVKAHRIEKHTPLEIEDAICRKDVATPSRSVADPALTRRLTGDLDNILMRALQKDADRRYESAAALGDDIRRHLENRPVMARPDTTMYRVGKFARRHSLGLVATILVFASLAGGMATAAYQARRAERRFDQVRQLANTFLFDFHDRIQHLQGTTEVRGFVVNTALEYLDSLAVEAGNDYALLTELAVAYQRVGDVQGDPRGGSLGLTREAMESYRKSLALAERINAAGRSDATVRRALATSHFKVGDMLAETGATRQGLAALEAGLSHAEALVRLGADPKDEVLLTNVLDKISSARLELRDVQGALTIHRRVVALIEGRASRSPDDNVRMSLAMSHVILGRLLRDTGDLLGAQQHYLTGIAMEEELVERQPANALYRRELRLALTWTGDLLGGVETFNQGTPQAALPYYHKALATAEALLAADPRNAQFQHDLAVVYERLGDAYETSEPGRAIELHTRSLALADALLQSSPQEYRYLRKRAASLRRLAAALRTAGSPQDALRRLREAFAISSSLAAAHPSNRDLQWDLYAVQLTMDTVVALGDLNVSREHYEVALRIAETAATVSPSDLYALWRRADAYERLGDLHARAAPFGEAAGAALPRDPLIARDFYRQSLDCWEGWPGLGVTSTFDTSREARVSAKLRALK